ncbi:MULTISPECIES: type I secretion system permease/ATPase [Rhodomicrobium]|uniref:type I secretion system permease/ATPase n=1 Tax=Rhodomicrobium TaxID=1068 RepID=UPI000B4BF66B|nr:MULTISPECIES: type I secretion system permease/ATPase [Rhodomicrobium]
MRNKLSNELRETVYAARFIFLSVAIFSFFLNLLMLVSPFYMLQVYDRVLTSGSKDTLYVLSILAVGLLAISALLEWIRGRILVRLGARLDRHVTHDLFAALIEDRIATRRSTGSQPIRDLESVRGFLTGPGLLAFFDAPWVPLFLGLIFLFHPVLGIVACVGAAILFGLAILSEFMTRAPWQRASSESLQAHRFAEASLRNADVIWALGMLGDLRRRWQEKHLSALAYSGAATDQLGTFSAIAKFVRPLLQTAMLGFGAYLVIDQAISAGVMIASSIVMGRALAPVEASITHWRSFISARSAYGRLSKLLVEYDINRQRMKLPAPKGKVSVEGMTLVPPGANKPALINITFQLMPGELLGVVGPSAAGKSSLARGLMGIWAPKVGHVRLDGADMAEWDRKDLGRHLGYLPQDVELFDGTVAENIARFEDLVPEAVNQAAQIANAHDMILHLPEGYDTQIGEGGCVLSGGQRQRIGLARAIYGLPCFIVLDEPNANLDAEGEAALRVTLKKLKELKKTVVIISHKRSTLADTDKLLVLDGGRVKSFGAQADVLQQLWKPQVVANQPPGAAPAPAPAAPAASVTVQAAPMMKKAEAGAKK